MLSKIVKQSKGCAPAADPSLVLGGASLVLLTSGTPKAGTQNQQPRSTTTTPRTKVKRQKHQHAEHLSGVRRLIVRFSFLLRLILGFLGALFGAFWGSFWASWGALLASGASGGSFWGSRRPFWGFVGAGSRRRRKKGPKMLKTAQNSSKTCFFSHLGPLGRPQNSSHSIISGGEKRNFLAFGCDFEKKTVWNSVKHEVLKFPKKLKPCILRVKMQFFIGLNGQMGEKARIS